MVLETIPRHFERMNKMKKKKIRNKDDNNSIEWLGLSRCPPGWADEWKKKISEKYFRIGDVKTTFRKPKPLYYQGSKIIKFCRLSLGIGYEITLETNEKIYLSNDEWLENVKEGL